MSGARDGTCGFHNTPNEDGAEGFWPLGSVAFRTNEEELIASSKALLVECQHADGERVAVLADVAAWYEDLALDLAEIKALPEIESPFQAVGLIEFDPDEDIPF